MSRNKTLVNGKRVHIWFEQEDWDYILAKWDDSVGASVAVRTIVHNFIEKLKARSNERSNPIGEADLDGFDGDENPESPPGGDTPKPGPTDGKGPSDSDGV